MEKKIGNRKTFTKQLLSPPEMKNVFSILLDHIAGHIVHLLKDVSQKITKNLI